MKRHCLMILALGIEVSILSAPLFAHHGNAAYDTEKKITMKGTVKQWIWSNPHCMLQFDVTDDSGQMVHWVAETENPSTMSRIGWSEKTFKAGDPVTVTALPLKNHNPVGRIIEVVTAEGEKLPGIRVPQTGSDAPAPYSKQ
jgi:hypothetical protein